MTRRCLAKISGFAVVLFVFAMSGRAAISIDPPEAFFTNVAQRILMTMASDFAPVTNVNAIMVWPTNYYSNGLHRVMQQAANICEATRTNAFPSVFRPIFGDFGTTNLFIVGWTNDNNIASLDSWTSENRACVPLVIAARKGFPNFNELDLRTDVLITRKLQLVKPDTNSLPNQTNQMFILGISNLVTVEAWNPYSKAFPFASTIEVSNTTTLMITNTEGVVGFRMISVWSSTNLASNSWERWPGSSSLYSTQSFRLPLFKSTAAFSNSVYVAQHNQFEQVGTNNFEVISTDPFYVPDWKLVLSNRLVYIHRVETNLIDFATLEDVRVIDLSSNLVRAALTPPQFAIYSGKNVWDTNRLFGPLEPTEGVRAQIDLSKDGSANSDWNFYGDFVGTFQGGISDRVFAASRFRDFVRLNSGSQLTLVTPFNPVSRLIIAKTWQANDPIVHSHAADLTALFPDGAIENVKRTETNLASIGPSSVGKLNMIFKPWGFLNGLAASQAELCDPLVSSSDNWNFPQGAPLSVEWLGRVHRGTPWQTIYLKSGAVSAADWLRQANSTQNHPTNDWRLVAALASIFNTNTPSLLVNSLSDWSNALAGVTVITNVLDDDEVVDPFTRSAKPGFITLTTSSNAPQSATILDEVLAERLRQPRGFFTDLSVLMRIPELSYDSPWLHRSDNQRALGISDEAYEILPAQLLSRLRVDPFVTIGQGSTEKFIEISGCDACSYQLETSTDLQHWDEVSDAVRMTNGSVQIPISTAGTNNFIRLRELH